VIDETDRPVTEDSLTGRDALARMIDGRRSKPAIVTASQLTGEMNKDTTICVSLKLLLIILWQTAINLQCQLRSTATSNAASFQAWHRVACHRDVQQKLQSSSNKPFPRISLLLPLNNLFC